VHRLHDTQCQWILSSYDKPEIRQLYAQHYIIPVQAFSGMKIKKHEAERVLDEEVLITNFLPSGEVVINVSSEAYQLGLNLDT
jgi:hypothetical protein